MRRLTLEERISRLERMIMKSMSKNEFLDIFDKPKRSDEKEWVSKLFSKYPSLNRMFSINTDVDSSRDSLFNLTLKAKNKNNGNSKGIYFVISTEDDDRGDMYCTAFDISNNKIASLPHFHLDKEMNQCAEFILRTMQSNENRRRRFENVPLTTFDCENFEQIIKDFLDDLPEIDIDVTDENSEHGFINVGVYNPKYLTEYDVIVNNAKSVDIEHDGKKIGTAKSFEDAAEDLAKHFMDEYMSGKYNKNN